MRTLKVLFVAAFAVLLSACASAGPKVRTDRDPGADLSAYKTFGFFDQLTGDRARYSSIMSNRLRAETIDQLTRLGYTYDVRNPQLRVSFYMQVQNKVDVRSTPVAGFRGRVWYPHDVETVGYKTGTLRIDLVDASRRQSVWQGIAEGRLSEDAMANPGQTVDEAVRSIFRQFALQTQI